MKYSIENRFCSVLLKILKAITLTHSSQFISFLCSKQPNVPHYTNVIQSYKILLTIKKLFDQFL